MRRVAMLLGTAAVIALGLAATPAQAHDSGWGYPAAREQATSHEQAWRQHQWRQHHYWRPWYDHQGYYAPRRHHGPGMTFAFNFR